MSGFYLRVTVTDLGMLLSTHGTYGFKAGAVLAARSISWKCWPAHNPLMFLPTVCPISAL